MASSSSDKTKEGSHNAVLCPAKSPWTNSGNIAPVAEANLNDIMSEQLAEGLHSEETEKFLKATECGSEVDLNELLSHSGLDCNSDEAIANMLQLQFNKEYDLDLKRREEKYNGTSKVSISLSNYMSAALSPQSGSEDEQDWRDEDPKKVPWDSFEAHEKSFPAMGSRGYVKVNNEVVTKHDVTMSGRRNACRVMESFPPCIHTGDATSFDMKLSNQVYNDLKKYSKAEEHRRTRLHDKDEKATSEMAIDPKTRLFLYKLINAEILKKVHGIISTGKEAVVLYAQGGGKVELEDGTSLDVPEEIAVKVFKTSLNEFKNRDKYIRHDYRFKDRFSKQNPRKVIHMWAEKELHNLNRIAKAGIPCPKAVLLKKHLLILSFIGTDGIPAPKLKEVLFPKSNENSLLRDCYKQVIEGMRRLYEECRLIHSDLSEYNILWHNGLAYFIDVSQSVEPSHPNALEFLYRDCHNMVTFFSKRGFEDIHTTSSLFSYVSSLGLKDGDEPSIIAQIRDFEKNVELLTFAKSEKSDLFDTIWKEGISINP